MWINRGVLVGLEGVHRGAGRTMPPHAVIVLRACGFAGDRFADSHLAAGLFKGAGIPIITGKTRRWRVNAAHFWLTACRLTWSTRWAVECGDDALAHLIARDQVAGIARVTLTASPSAPIIPANAAVAVGYTA